LAKLLSDYGQMKEARSVLEASTAALREIPETEPEVRYIDKLLKRSYDNLADVYVRLGQEDLAAVALRRAEHR
jgi:hypothetical protein